MQRRDFFKLIAGSASAWPLAAWAQQLTKTPKIGFLGNSPNLLQTLAFKRGLANLGYVDGQNIFIEYRFFENRSERLPGLAADLVNLKPDLIVTVGAQVTQAVIKANQVSIPVVFAIAPDAVEVGIVRSAERPGGNMTGFTSFDPQQPRKQLQLFKEAIPALRR